MLIEEASNKMGQELHELLGKHRYEMWECLKELAPCMRPVPGGETPYEWAISERAMAVVRELLAKIDSLDLRDRKQMEDLKAMRK